MDDDSKEFKRNKPQQRIYKPGSGPLRRSCYGFDTKMDSSNSDRREKYHNHYGSQTSVNDATGGTKDFSVNMRHKKPEQQLYVAKSNEYASDTDRLSKGAIKGDSSSQYNNRRVPNDTDKSGYNSNTGKHSRDVSRRHKKFENNSMKDGPTSDQNYTRHFRPSSETRSMSPSQFHGTDQNSLDRNRDSRSMETSGGRHTSAAGGKPPSGRRNSAGYVSDIPRPKHLVNLDNIPPRFRKKYLEQAGHYSSKSVDQIHRDKPVSNPSTPPMSQDNYNNAGPNWSQTLPSRGRGRLRDSASFDREKFMNNYLRHQELEGSRKSTPSGSYANLYDGHAINNLHIDEKSDVIVSSCESQKEMSDNASLNGISVRSNTISEVKPVSQMHESDNDLDSETTSQISSTLLDVTNLDWTEEVEKNIKLEEDSSISFSQNTRPKTEEIKPIEHRDSKRSGKSRRRDRRSSSRGLKINDKKPDLNRKDSTASVQTEHEIHRKDSVASIPYESLPPNIRNRERRDSHRSNRSSTIGNSRDDLDRWRSLRSYSRERSTEGRIVSQCNSRDASANRATSPRDNDGFRVPPAVHKSAAWVSSNHHQKKNNGSWAAGRTPSSDRGRHSPTPSVASVDPSPGGGRDGGRRNKKRSGRGRRARASDTPHAPQPAPASLVSHAPPPPTNFSAPMNWREEILESKKHVMHDKPQENTHQRNRLNSTLSEKSNSDSNTSHPGLIMLPPSSINHLQKDLGRAGTTENQKTLYDHHNPSKPIIVQKNNSKIDIRMEQVVKESSNRGGLGHEANDAARAARHRTLLQEVDRADVILQTHSMRGPLSLAAHWDDVTKTRLFLQNALQKLLMSDLKYCQADNIEHHFWKILYYNFIEVLRKSFTQISPEDKLKVVKLLNTIIEEGNIFFESLVQELEKTYKFNIEDYINDNHILPPKGLGYVGLALISVQKLYVFLGDLARYKEQVNETANYAKSKFWYTKAQQINPKNGRPYNQLAILAIYARRKLDAVYYYMRSLMSSNPFHSARESLLSLFEENRKKYEAVERKRRAALEIKKSEKEGSEAPETPSALQGNRKEVWVRPSGHRTTTLPRIDPQAELLTAMSSVELNKTFITSYLHVHGKLITKIGMESFHECASVMLRQFRALLHRKPLPTPAARLLQLTALNMFAVETTALKNKDGSSGDRPAWLECALGISLLMFGALLERCCALLPEPADTQHHADALLLLPAIKARVISYTELEVVRDHRYMKWAGWWLHARKCVIVALPKLVWSDWMLCHSSLWNPPPSFDNFEIDCENDPWDWLANLMNTLEALDDKTIHLESEPKDGLICVRLPEDTTLGGFTPLMYMEVGVAWVRTEPAVPYHAAEHALRAQKLLFFGTEYLVGVDPPVLRLEYPSGAAPRYVSAVERAQPDHPPLQNLVEDLEDDSSISTGSGTVGLSEDTEKSVEGADSVTRKLLRRKELLETRKATLDRHRERMQEILGSGAGGGVETEVRPRWLVPDTNCFIDHLPLLQAIAATPSQPYIFAVPLVVMTELAGLQKCSRVGGNARTALSWVSGAGAGVRLATSLGSLLASRAFTAEKEQPRSTNDDKVLATALNLHANLTASETESREDNNDPSCLKRLREVVLLTDDRNLRVKALAAELPTRDLPSFVQWAGLARQHAPTDNKD